MNIELLDKDFESTELCSHCGQETDFRFNPVTDMFIVCEHCGTKILPCTLCDVNKGCNDNCINNIRETLWEDIMNQ